jgi:hypothetical protein
VSLLAFVHTILHHTVNIYTTYQGVHKNSKLTCTASANKSTPFNMAARPSTPNRISFPVAMPRRATTLDRVDWMADWRRLREALLSEFILLLLLLLLLWISLVLWPLCTCFQSWHSCINPSSKHQKMDGGQEARTTGLGSEPIICAGLIAIKPSSFSVNEGFPRVKL